jgi:peptide subunit release factor 1 (eRF1)
LAIAASAAEAYDERATETGGDVLTPDVLERLRAVENGQHPVLSLYLGLRPEIGELRSLPARLKELLAPMRATLDGLPRPQAMSLRADIDSILAMTDRIGSDLGRGVAIFRSSGDGLDEYVSLPVSMRDRALVGVRPYLQPVDALLERLRPYAIVVVERGQSTFFRTQLGKVAPWGVIEDEALRKANYGGFAGYDERRTRAHADTLAQRHYRETAERLRTHLDAGRFELLAIGGSAEHIDGLVAELAPPVVERLVGTFTIDPHTMTSATVAPHYERLAAEHEQTHETEIVIDLMERHGNGRPAALGLAAVLEAVNQRAVDSLVLRGGPTLGGGRCTECGWLTEDDGGSCAVCGHAVVAVADLLDEMAVAVRAASGRVEHILGDAPMGEHRIGARLRFAVSSGALGG